MTKTQAQILELFQTLPEAEKRELAEQLYEQAVRGSFYDRTTPEQRAELDRSIAEADRNEGAEVSVVIDRLARKFGFARTA
jgi:hypothetical protein